MKDKKLYDDLVKRYNISKEEYFTEDLPKKIGSVRNIPKSKTKGADINLKIELFLGDMIKGKNIRYKITRDLICNTCSGSGMISGKIKSCEGCNGTGLVLIKDRNPIIGYSFTEHECSECNGLGEIIENPCPDCKGAGIVRTSSKFCFNIPKGTLSESVFKFKGEGNRVKYGEPGDIIVTFIEKLPSGIKRIGYDLYGDIAKKSSGLLPGKKIEFKLGLSTLSFTVPESYEIGKPLRLAKKGIPRINSSGKIIFGNLYVKLHRIP